MLFESMSKNLSYTFQWRNQPDYEVLYVLYKRI